MKPTDDSESDLAHVDALVFGADATSGILAAHPVTRPDGTLLIRGYRRRRDGRLATADAAMRPYFVASDDAPIEQVGATNIRTLEGPGFYRHQLFFDDAQAYSSALRRLMDGASDDHKHASAIRLGGLVRQHLTVTGATMFKGLQPSELHRLQLDIEVVSDGLFPNARRAEDEVIIVALSDNRGFEQALDSRGRSEAELLAETVDTLLRLNPDVIEGHNIFRFDLPYLTARCKRHRVPFTIGRDGSAPRTYSSTMRFAERSVEFTVFDVAGRHVIDTYLLLVEYDVSRRDLPGFGLKDAARYFGLASTNRTYVEGADIAATWRQDPERLTEYALDDVRETRGLATLLSGSAFFLTQMVPMSYQRVARTGSATKIEALMTRAYLAAGRALPAPDAGAVVSGGYVSVPYRGIAHPVVYADVASLYPSVMLGNRIAPRSDELGVFSVLLERLTALRLETKREMNAARGTARAELDARQSAFKVLINSFYGYLGFGVGLFSDFAAADQVTTTGRRIVRQASEIIRERGGQIVEVDTDGVFFIPPNDVCTEDAERAFVEFVSDQLPAGIELEFAGRYDRMLSYRVKNYALLDYDDRLTLKGSSLISRSMERFGRRFVRRSIRHLLRDDVAGLHDLYLRHRAVIVSHGWEGAAEFSRTETLKTSLDRYRREVASGERTRSAAYEVGLLMAAAGHTVRRGDRVAFYVSAVPARAPQFERARPADAWSKHAPDEDTAYYLKRLDEATARFRPFFRPGDFRSVFSEEDLFGFSPDGIVLLSGPTAVSGDRADEPGDPN